MLGRLLTVFIFIACAWADTFSIDLRSTPTHFPHFWEECVGSGHALLALRADYQAHLTQVTKELGFKRVRFHGLFDDDMSVVLSQNSYSWFNVDQVFDFLLSIGMRPYVEISFMPELLASGSQTIMHYKGNITPPKSYAQWNALVAAFANHLISRYTIQEVATWSFEVWNEPNCGFWSGDQASYFTLYQNTANTLKSVNPNLKVGGPVTCASAWITDFLKFTSENKVPIDFVATHEYPTDIVPYDKDILKKVFANARKEAGNYPLYYSEFNDGLYSSPAYHDTPFASAFLFKTLYEVQGLVDLLSWWTFSDIFEEGGQTSVPFFTNNGWGLLNIYQIPKPTYRAFQLLHKLGTQSVPVTTVSAPKNSTVGAWSVLSPTQTTLDILLYNFDVPTAIVTNATVTVQLNNLKSVPSAATIVRIDDNNANAPAAWVAMGSPMYPTKQQNAQMMQASELHPQVLILKSSGANQAQFTVALPKYGVAVVSVPL